MKNVRTKAQEIVNQLYGYGVYIVADDNVPALVKHFDAVFQDLLAPAYVQSLLKYVRGERLDRMDSQRKYHAMRNLRVAIGGHSALPLFLVEVEYPDKQWSLSDLALVLYGEKGDPKVYNLELPEPAGKGYTTKEVRSIVAQLNS